MGLSPMIHALLETLFLVAVTYFEKSIYVVESLPSTSIESKEIIVPATLLPPFSLLSFFCSYLPITTTIPLKSTLPLSVRFPLIITIGGGTSPK